MKTPIRALLVVLCALIVLSTFCATCVAITGNSKPDSTPYVGIVVLFSDAARTHAISYSTGILVSPTVVLTAGHSVPDGVAASVCFDQGPITSKTDQTGEMTFDTNKPVYNGIPIPYPAYATEMDKNHAKHSRQAMLA